MWSADWSWSAKYQWSLKKEGACIRGKANTTLSTCLIPLGMYTCVSADTGTCSMFLEQDLLSEGSRIDLVSGRHGISLWTGSLNSTARNHPSSAFQCETEGAAVWPPATVICSLASGASLGVSLPPAVPSSNPARPPACNQNECSKMQPWSHRFPAHTSQWVCDS